MTNRTERRAARGSALLLVLMLLVVMSLVSVAVVRLSSQGRANAAAQSSHDLLVECANAAQAQLWAAIAVNGKAYYTQPSTSMAVASIRLPDGKELLSPAHLDSGDTSIPADAIRQLGAGSPSGETGDGNVTNTFGKGSGTGANGNSATWVTARCRDSAGRVHEVEFAFRFAL